MNPERLAVLTAFIGSQMNLTDGHPHKPGPGEVKLNHAEALEVVEALESVMVADRIGDIIGVDEKELTPERIRNLRNWAAARIDTLSGTRLIVALCNYYLREKP